MDNLANSSLYGLRGALKHLERKLKTTKPNTEAWHHYAEQINAVKGRIAELNQDLKNSESSWGKFKNWAVNTWPAIASHARAGLAMLSSEGLLHASAWRSSRICGRS